MSVATMIRALIVNAGSSTLKLAAFEISPTEEKKVWRGQLDCTDHHQACQQLLSELNETHPDWIPTAIGHRVVHGGTQFIQPTYVDEGVVQKLRNLTPLAPLHQPANIAGIEATRQLFPMTLQFACFDTAFHRSRSFASETYALPRHFFEQGVRRYGFHGLSYQFISAELATHHPNLHSGKVIICHLGNGASMAAVHGGTCVETTMGFTPTDGLPMGTRCGQIDPGVLLHLIAENNYTVDTLSRLLTKQSGLLGLSGGISGDMRDLLSNPHPHCREAIDVFVYRIAYFIGALTASLQGLNGIVFTGGIGEHAPAIRADVINRLQWLGAQLDSVANQHNQQLISLPQSAVTILVIPTDEERMIARAIMNLTKQGSSQ